MRVPAFVLTQTCQISKYLGQTPQGASLDTAYTSNCRFESHRKKYTDKNGKEFISRARFYLPVEAPDGTSNWGLKQDSRISVGSDNFIVMEAEDQIGFTPSHVELLVI